MTITVGQFIARSTKELKEHGVDSPRGDIMCCVCEICGINRGDVLTQPDRILQAREWSRLHQALKRRLQGESIAYILGYKYFYKYKFQVDSRVLVPRPETEKIVERILSQESFSQKKCQILDMGTGSGCVGLSLVKELDLARLTAVDISTGALEVFYENAKRLQVFHKVQTFLCDLTSLKPPYPLRVYDIIVANPPYIAFEDMEVCPDVVQYEPHVALFTEGGIKAPLTWLKKASGLLKPQGIFMMEFGLGQGPFLLKKARELKVFDKVELVFDDTHRERFIYGVRSWTR